MKCEQARVLAERFAAGERPDGPTLAQLRAHLAACGACQAEYGWLLQLPLLIEEAMVDVKESVRSGESISKPLSRVAVFPAMVTHMISIGEETGALDTMLHKVADFYEDECETTVKSLTTIIEPIMMLFIGGIVGVIVISMYLPMFNMMNLVN